MNSRDAGAQADTATSVRPTVRDLFLGRRFRVHRLILLTVAVALILVIAYVIKVSGSVDLEGLPGVTRVDREQHQVTLSPTSTPSDAQEVFRRAEQLSESWTLILGPARLVTGAEPGAAATDSQDAVELMHRLGTAGLTEPAVITVDAYAPRMDAEPTGPNRSIPAARALIAELSADGGTAIDRIAVSGHDQVTIMAAALRLLVSDTAALFELVSAAGTKIIKGLRDHEYGLRGFVMADPDGNRIDVGQVIETVD